MSSLNGGNQLVFIKNKQCVGHGVEFEYYINPFQTKKGFILFIFFLIQRCF
jgi:hypothetical protein